MCNQVALTTVYRITIAELAAMAWDCCRSENVVTLRNLHYQVALNTSISRWLVDTCIITLAQAFCCKPRCVEAMVLHLLAGVELTITSADASRQDTCWDAALLCRMSPLLCMLQSPTPCSALGWKAPAAMCVQAATSMDCSGGALH